VEILAIHLIGSDVLPKELHNAFALHAPDSPFAETDRPVMRWLNGFHCRPNAHRRTFTQNPWRDESARRRSIRNARARNSLSSNHNVEWDEWFVPELVDRSMCHVEPFATDSLAWVEEREEAVSVLHNPAMKNLVGLKLAGFCPVSSARERNNLVSDSRNSNAASVELFLDDDVIVPVSRLDGEERSLLVAQPFVCRTSTGTG
jgi:hypothetical protein